MGPRVGAAARLGQRDCRTSSGAPWKAPEMVVKRLAHGMSVRGRLG